MADFEMILMAKFINVIKKAVIEMDRLLLINKIKLY